METPANCATWDAKDTCGFLVCVLAEVTQDKHLALFAGQGLENGEDSNAHLSLLKSLRRIGLDSAPVGLCGEDWTFLKRETVMLFQVVFKTKHRVSFTGAKELSRRVENDAIEPRGKRLAGLKEMAITIDLQKTLLGNVLGA